MKGIIYRGLGVGLILLSIVGAVVPLLPSTPFILLASGCFMKSSPHWNDRLLRIPFFGKALRDWQTSRYIRPSTKLMACLSIVVMGGANLLCANHTEALNAVLIATMLSAMFVVLRLPTRANCSVC